MFVLFINDLAMCVKTKSEVYRTSCFRSKVSLTDDLSPDAKPDIKNGSKLPGDLQSWESLPALFIGLFDHI